MRDVLLLLSLEEVTTVEDKVMPFNLNIVLKFSARLLD